MQEPTPTPSVAERAQVLARGLALSALVGVGSGAASALFLWLLDRATAFRELHERLVYALPLAGLGIGWIYERYGQAIRGGNNLLIERTQAEGPRVPARMGPLVLLGTVLTHLFGGSAGREGTAVQMGGSWADLVAERVQASPRLRRQLLLAAAAGGFGSVFGTPWAGALFGLEFSAPGRLQLGALVPIFVASFVGDATTRALGIQHTLYPAAAPATLTPLLFGKWLVFALAVALVAGAFIELLQWLKQHAERLVPRLPWRLCLGGLAVVGAWQWLGTSDYLGLGVPTILRAFVDPQLPHAAFAYKLVLTALTLGAGFLGGEVTPLFFVGAALGNALAGPLQLPLGLAASVGMASVFAAASNTPLSLSIMAIELFGWASLPHVALVSALAYALTGSRSIYAAQLRARPRPAS